MKFKQMSTNLPDSMRWKAIHGTYGNSIGVYGPTKERAAEKLTAIIERREKAAQRERANAAYLAGLGI